MNDLFSNPTLGKQLRPYQEDAIQRLRSSLASNHRRPILQLATGAGKTLIAANIVKGALAKRKRVAFFVPALSLVQQTVDAFRAEGIDAIGVLQGNHAMTDYSQPVQIATVQTFGKRKDRPQFDFAIVDEAHIRNKAVEAIMAEDERRIFVGLTATPWAKGLGRVYDDLVVGATLSDLISQGYLSDFRAYASGHPDLTGVRTVAGDFHQGDLSSAMSQKRLVADVVSTWLARGEGRPTICFAVDRSHADQLRGDFERVGIPAGYIDADTDVVERDHIKRQFIAGRIKVVCNCRTLTTGIDWPVGCIIDAAPTQSEMLHVQKIGRGLRVNDGIPDCIILDHADNSLRLGLVTDIHHDALDGSLRGQAKPKARVAPLPKTCPSCALLKPASVHACPQCGFAPERKTVVPVDEGDLVEITGKGKARPPTTAEKQRFWSMALWVDNSRKKGGKLALGLYKSKFGVWPRGMIDIPTEPDLIFKSYEHSRRIAYAKQMESKRGVA